MPRGGRPAVLILEKERIEVGEDVWHEHGLVFPTSVGTPVEPRTLNRHFDGIRSHVAFLVSGCTISGTRS